MKTLALLLSLTFISLFLSAQTTLSFCTSVEGDGYCAFNNTKFITSSDSATGRLYMLLRNSNGIGQTHVTYKIFSVDKEGVETYQNAIEQNMEAQWLYAWQIGFFKTPGKFKVKVMSDDNKTICSKSFELYDVW